MRAAIVEQFDAARRHRRAPTLDGRVSKRFTPRSRTAWRKWLAENHARFGEVWVVFYKKATGRPTLTYDDAVEEAICFGWIDGIRRRIDDERYMHRFSPRTARSQWSETNKRRAAKLEKAGLIEPPGHAAIAAAKHAGEWQRTPASPNDSEMPSELAAALGRDRDDDARFAALPPSHRKAYRAYVGQAKRPATRKRRAERVIEVIRSGGAPIDV